MKDILLINFHSVINQEKIKIQNYNIHQINTKNELHSGVAIAVRRDTHYKLIDDFETDMFMLGVTIDTPQGHIHIITTYIPPRDSYLHYHDFYKILKSTDLVYIIRDLNARHLILGHNNKNVRGELFATLINRGHAQHTRPHHPTFLTYRSSISLDIILSNHRTFHNT